MIVLSFYDYTGVALKPWQGFDCYAFDIQHKGEIKRENVTYCETNLYNTKVLAQLTQRFKKGEVSFILGFPPCTDLAVSGARHFEKKRKKNQAFQIEAAEYAQAIAKIADLYGCPYVIENPISVLSTLWRKPDYMFHPFQYGGYILESEAVHPDYPEHIAARDAYSKKTCLWTGNGFIMPEPRPVDCESFGSSLQHRKLGGKSLKTKNIRSATPRGFAKAVYLSNKEKAS
tara:strand:- start:141 stop:830 length:690 start_codon:yes stop_codon:yes gene_type:complete